MYPTHPSANKTTIPIFIQILLPYVTGICIAYQHRNNEFKEALAWTFGMLLLILICCNISYLNWKIYHFKPWIKLTLLVLFAVSGALSCISHDERLAIDYYANKHSDQLKVCIIEEPQLRNGITMFKVKVLSSYRGRDMSSASGRLKVSVKLDSISPLKFKFGQELIILSKYKSIAPTVNPGVFDYRDWLAVQQIYHQAFLRQQEVHPTQRTSGNPVMSFALALREQQVSYYRKWMKDSKAFAVASTLILGYRSDLDPEILQVYSKTGTIHVLSVSGMHVALVYMILNWLLQFMNRRKSLRVLKFVICICMIWGYALLSGCSASVLRAAIMLSVMVLAKTFSKGLNSYNVLGFSAFALLVYDPYLIWDLGFQLSFLAVLGLVALHPLIQNFWIPKNRWIAKLWGAIALSMAAQLSTFPFSIYYFHQFPVYFLLSNLFIILPSALIMYLGIAILIFRLGFLIPLFEKLIAFMNRGLEHISNLPHANLAGIWIDRVDLILLCSSIFFLTLALQHAQKFYLISGIICLLTLQCGWSYREAEANRQQKIIVFALKRYQAVAIVSGRLAYVFTDLDPKSKTYSQQVQPALDSLSIRQFKFYKKTYRRSNPDRLRALQFDLEKANAKEIIIQTLYLYQ